MPKTLRRYNKSRNRKNRLKRKKSSKKKKYKRKSKKQRGGSIVGWGSNDYVDIFSFVKDKGSENEKKIDIKYSFDNDIFLYEDFIYSIEGLNSIEGLEWIKSYLEPKVNNLKNIHKLINFHRLKDSQKVTLLGEGGLLGEGTYASVFPFVYEYYDGELKTLDCAVKIMRCKGETTGKPYKAHYCRVDEDDPSKPFELQVIDELNGLGDSIKKNNNIVNVYDTGSLKLSKELTAYYIIMDKYDYDLAKFINIAKVINNGVFILKQLLHQVAKFIKLFHALKYVHNDLKPGNILIKKVEPVSVVEPEPVSVVEPEPEAVAEPEPEAVTYEAYVSDFGLCGKLFDGSRCFIGNLNCRIGATLYRKNNENVPQDIIAFGIMLFEIFVDPKFKYNEEYRRGLFTNTEEIIKYLETLDETPLSARGNMTIAGLHYVSETGESSDKLSIAEVQALIAAGTITEETLVWAAGMGAWEPLGECRPLSARGNMTISSPLKDLITKCLNDHFTLDDMGLTEFVDHPWFSS